MRLWPGDKDGDGLTPAQGLLNTKCEMLTLVRAEAGALSLSCNSEYHFCWSSHLGPLRWTFRCPQAPKRRAAQVSLLLDRSTNRRITEQKEEARSCLYLGFAWQAEINASAQTHHLEPSTSCQPQVTLSHREETQIMQLNMYSAGTLPVYGIFCYCLWGASVSTLSLV